MWVRASVNESSFDFVSAVKDFVYNEALNVDITGCVDTHVKEMIIRFISLMIDLVKGMIKKKR